MALAPYFAGFSAVPKFARALTLNPTSVPAASIAVETFSVAGLDPTDMLVVASAPSLEAGITLVSARVSAKNVLELTFRNNTAGAIDPASQTFFVEGL
jgi:hypothetical protein